ncbi:hypothetical protein CR513_10463, partial [Mucuna pruriens]
MQLQAIFKNTERSHDKVVLGVSTSIHSHFQHLATTFVFQFATNRASRFTTWIKSFFVKEFQKGLRTSPFSDSLALRKPASMEEIKAKVEKHIEVERIWLTNSKRALKDLRGDHISNGELIIGHVLHSFKGGQVPNPKESLSHVFAGCSSTYEEIIEPIA